MRALSRARFFFLAMQSPLLLSFHAYVHNVDDRRILLFFEKRLSQRLSDFQQLPFLVGSNPYMRQVYDAYAEVGIL